VASGLASGMVVNGSLSKTAVNGAAGARSQISGLVCAGLTVVTLLLLTGLFEDLPEATLAAVVIAAVIELVDIGALATLYRIYTRALGRAYGGIAARPDFIAALAAMAGVLIFDTLPGLFLGIAISLLLLVYRVSRPHIAVLGRVPGAADQWVDVERHPEDEPVPGIVVLRVEAGLFFANAEHVRATVRSHVADDTKAVVSMPRRCRSSTSAPHGCWKSWPRTSGATASRSSLRATSVRCATSCAARERKRPSCRSTARSRTPSTRSPAARPARGTDAPAWRRAGRAAHRRIDHRAPPPAS
jgi:MFS superfamily sulfate permease-like transporter